MHAIAVLLPYKLYMYSQMTLNIQLNVFSKQRELEVVQKIRL